MRQFVMGLITGILVLSTLVWVRRAWAEQPRHDGLFSVECGSVCIRFNVETGQSWRLEDRGWVPIIVRPY